MNDETEVPMRLDEQLALAEQVRRLTAENLRLQDRPARRGERTIDELPDEGAD